MSCIQQIIEPDRVWLVWQSSLPGLDRSRRFVGEIVRNPDTSEIVFRYLHGTPDYISAEADGFFGYPAFKKNIVEHNQGVLEAFMRRLPPRNRDDFNEYLLRHRLPESFNYSDLALLGYTGAKLPSDNFEFCIDFGISPPPLDFLMEVAGFRHHSKFKAADLEIGEEVLLVCEPENKSDPNAIALLYRDTKIGYVGRSYTSAFRNWFTMGFDVRAVLERVNGSSERPLVYLYITVID